MPMGTMRPPSLGYTLDEKPVKPGLNPDDARLTSTVLSVRRFPTCGDTWCVYIFMACARYLNGTESTSSLQVLSLLMLNADLPLTVASGDGTGILRGACFLSDGDLASSCN